MWKFSSDAVRARNLWVMTFLSFICALVVLGLASDLSRNYTDLGCSTPRRTAWHVVLSVFTFAWTLYLGIVTGPWFKKAAVPYGWVVLVVNVILAICWISAAAVYNQDPSDVCMACSGPGSQFGDDMFVVTSGDTIFCYCYLQPDNSWSPQQPDYSDSVKRMVEYLYTRASTGGTSLKLVDTTVSLIIKCGFDSALVFLFLISTICLVRLRNKLYQPGFENMANPQEMKQGQYQSDINAANNMAQDIPQF